MLLPGESFAYLEQFKPNSKAQNNFRKRCLFFLAIFYNSTNILPSWRRSLCFDEATGAWGDPRRWFEGAALWWNTARGSLWAPTVHTMRRSRREVEQWQTWTWAWQAEENSDAERLRRPAAGSGVRQQCKAKKCWRRNSCQQWNIKRAIKGNGETCLTNQNKQTSFAWIQGAS